MISLMPFLQFTVCHLDRLCEAGSQVVGGSLARRLRIQDLEEMEIRELFDVSS